MESCIHGKAVVFSTFHGKNVVLRESGTVATGLYQSAHGQFITCEPLTQGQAFDIEARGVGILKINVYETKGQAIDWVRSKKPLPKRSMRVKLNSIAFYHVSIPSPGEHLIIVAERNLKRSTFSWKTGQGTTMAFDIECGDMVVSINNPLGSHVTFDTFCKSRHISMLTSPQHSSVRLKHFNPSSLCHLDYVTLRIGAVFIMDVISESVTPDAGSYFRVCLTTRRHDYANIEGFICYGSARSPDKRGEKLTVQNDRTVCLRVTSEGIHVEKRDSNKLLDLVAIEDIETCTLWFELHKVSIRVWQLHDNFSMPRQRYPEDEDIPPPAEFAPSPPRHKSPRTPARPPQPPPLPCGMCPMSEGYINTSCEGGSDSSSSAAYISVMNDSDYVNMDRDIGFPPPLPERLAPSCLQNLTYDYDLYGRSRLGAISLDRTLPTDESANKSRATGPCIRRKTVDQSSIQIDESHYEKPEHLFSTPRKPNPPMCRPATDLNANVPASRRVPDQSESRSRHRSPEAHVGPTRTEAGSPQRIRDINNANSTGFSVGFKNRENNRRDQDAQISSAAKCKQWLQDSFSIGLPSPLEVNVPQWKRESVSDSNNIYAIHGCGSQGANNSSVWLSYGGDTLENQNVQHNLDIDFRPISGRLPRVNTVRESTIPSCLRDDIPSLTTDPTLYAGSTALPNSESETYPKICSGPHCAHETDSRDLEVPRSDHETDEQMNPKDTGVSPRNFDICRLSRRGVSDDDDDITELKRIAQEERADSCDEITYLKRVAQQEDEMLNGRTSQRVEHASEIAFDGRNANTYKQPPPRPCKSSASTWQDPYLQMEDQNLPFCSDMATQVSLLTQALKNLQTGESDSGSEQETRAKCPWVSDDGRTSDKENELNECDSSSSEQVTMRHNGSGSFKRNIVESAIYNESPPPVEWSSQSAILHRGPTLVMPPDNTVGPLKRTNTMQKNMDVSPRPSTRKGLNSKQKFINTEYDRSQFERDTLPQVPNESIGAEDPSGPASDRCPGVTESPIRPAQTTKSLTFEPGPIVAYQPRTKLKAIQHTYV